MILAPIRSRAGEGPAGAWVFGETPTPAVDGSTTGFAVTNAYLTGSLIVTRASLRMHPTTDFVENNPVSGTFTMTVPPLVGEPLICDYLKA